MKIVRSLVISLFVISAWYAPARADVSVVVSIKPIHSLVAGVMEGLGTPTLILKGAASPHTYSLAPSEARALQNARVVFWVGHELEAFLEKPLMSLGTKANTVELMDAPGLAKLEMREGGGFETHDHDHKDEHDHDRHSDKHDDDVDAHIWLDPENAKAMTRVIADALSEADPAHAAAYARNAEKLGARLDALIREVRQTLEPVRGKGFVVFHDAYQYFEKRFDVNVLGAFTVNTDVLPGAEQLSEIREIIEHDKVTCVFSEPQFNPDIINAVAKDTNIKTGVLDPLGATLNPGKKLYFDLISNMSKSFKTC